MKEKLTAKKEEYQKKLNDAIKEMNTIKGQIKALNERGANLANEATFINGKIEAIDELLQ